MSKKFAVLLSLLALLVVMVVPGFAQDGGEDEEELGTIVDIAVAASTGDEPEFTILVAAVQAAGFAELLSSDGPFTVFAPTDEAFAAALTALGVTAEDLLADTELLSAVLAYHVIPGEFEAAAVVEYADTSIATAYAGSTVDITVTEEGGVMIDNANVIATDIFADNGVIHVIDAVILPSEDEGPAEMEMMEAPEQTIADIVVASTTAETPEFTVLLAAAQAAGAVEALTEGGPYTVFAPTDAAFLALLADLGVTPEDLLGDTETLLMVLSYHIVPAPFYAADVVALDGAYLGTLLPGYALEISLDGDAVYVNDAQVIATDISAANGVVHVIDSVLVPSDEEEME